MSSWCGASQAENSSAMFYERFTNKRCGDDVSEVVCSGHFDEEDALGLFSEADHGHAWGHPFRLERDAFAAGVVDEDAGVGENNSWASLLKTEFFEEGAYAYDGFDVANRLEELSGAGGDAGGGGEVVRHQEAAADGLGVREL